MSTSFNFMKNKKFLDNSSSIGIALPGIQEADVLAAITANNKFPARKIEIGSLQFSASTNQDISFGTKNNGKVKFACLYANVAESASQAQRNDSVLSL